MERHSGNDLSPGKKKKWLKAADEEIKSLIEIKTWELVSPSPGKIRWKWTFKEKYNTKDEIEKYKATLLAKSCQKYRCDYEETFAQHATITSFLMMAVHKKPKANQINIKTTFLHGNLDEVYTAQPEGYISLVKKIFVS